MNSKTNLFIYGTLMSPQIFDAVCACPLVAKEATLQDHELRRVRGEAYPAMFAQVGCEVQGLLLRDITPQLFVRLDDYEGYLYLRSEVEVLERDPSRDELVRAQTYLIHPDHAHLLSEASWSFSAFMDRDFSAYWQKHFC